MRRHRATPGKPPESDLPLHALPTGGIPSARSPKPPTTRKATTAMKRPALRRTASATTTPAESVIHYEVLDAASGTLLDWGSTTSLDTIVEAATQARADLAGRRTHVRRLTQPSWATAASWPQTTGTAAYVRANRVQIAASDLRHTVEDAHAAGVDPDLLNQAADLDLQAIRTLLTTPAQDRPDPLDLPTWNPHYPDNLDRAAWAARALALYGQSTRQLQHGTGADTDLVAEIAGDLERLTELEVGVWSVRRAEPCLVEIRASPRASPKRSTEAGGGEAEGLNVSLAAANNKLDGRRARRSDAVGLGMPAFREIVSRTLATHNRRCTPSHADVR